MLLRTITRAGVALAAAMAVGLVGTSPARAAQDVSDLRVSSSLDRQTLRLGDTVTVTVRVENAGPAVAQGVQVRSEHGNCIDWTTPALADSDGYDLPVGESRVFTRTGKVAQCGHDRGRVETYYFIHASNEPVNGYNFTTARARVVSGVAAITFSADNSMTEASGARRPVAGVTVAVYDEFDGADTKVVEVRTGADGTVTVADLVPGDYHAVYTAPAGWELNQPARVDLRLTAGDRVDQQIALLRTSTPPNGEPTTEPSGGPAATPTTAAPTDGGGTGGGDGGTLPITGANAAAFGLTGLALLVLGGLAFVLTRRRRSRFVAGD